MTSSLGLGLSMVWVHAPFPMANPADDAISLESGEGEIGLEDGSGVILLE